MYKSVRDYRTTTMIQEIITFTKSLCCIQEQTYTKLNFVSSQEQTHNGTIFWVTCCHVCIMHLHQWDVLLMLISCDQECTNFISALMGKQYLSHLMDQIQNQITSVQGMSCKHMLSSGASLHRINSIYFPSFTTHKHLHAKMYTSCQLHALVMQVKQ